METEEFNNGKTKTFFHILIFSYLCALVCQICISLDCVVLGWLILKKAAV